MVKEQTTSTERMRTFRRKLREDKYKHESHKEKERKRLKEMRSKRRAEQLQNTEMLEKARAKKREEMRIYRAKKKTEMQNEKRKSDVARKKKASIEKAKNRKQRYREAVKSTNLNAEKTRIRAQSWRMRIKLKSPSVDENALSNEEDTLFPNRMAEYRATQKVKRSLPDTPAKKARLVKKILTPRTSKILRESDTNGISARKTLDMGAAVAEQVQQQIRPLKRKGTLPRERLLHYKVLKYTLANVSAKKHMRGQMKKYFNFKRGIPQLKQPLQINAVRKRRKDAMGTETKNVIREFYLSPEITREMPHKNEAIKIKDDLGDEQVVQKNYMLHTIKEAHQMFQQRHPNLKVGFTSFRKAKPQNVKKVSETNRRTCLCTLCSNVALKLEAVKKFSHIQGLKQPDIKESLKPIMCLTKSEISAASVCVTENEYPNKACIDGVCKSSTCNRLDIMFQPLQEYGNCEVEWFKWSYTTIESSGKNRMTCNRNETSLSALINALKKDMETYPGHIFRALWQHRQLQSNITGLRQGEVIICMDFSENYRCHYRDEVQSGYFDQIPVTIHPMMCYYLKDNALVKHAIIGVSDDTRHDWCMVKQFEEQATEIVGRQILISKIYQWTDGCAAQYKGKHSFFDISLRNVPTCRSFFETSHGKSVCDGLGAVVKNACSRAVLTGSAVISNAEKFFEHCASNLAHGPTQKSGYISIWNIVFAKDVVRENDLTVSTVKGTRKIHCVQSAEDGQKLKTRFLSCFCLSCVGGDTANCVNKAWIDDWQTISIQTSQSEKDNESVRVTEEVLPQPTTNNEALRVIAGMYVAVKFNGKTRRSVSVAMAKVTEVLQDEVKVDFMKKCGDSTFIWPDKNDEWVHPQDDIVCEVPPPELLNEREIYRIDIQAVKNELSDKYKYIRFI